MDVLIGGAGFAGLALAIALRQGLGDSFTVAVADPALGRASTDARASAIVAARHKIVEGAVGMVESALHLLSSKNIIELDEEKKAAMVSNLMVVLCGDRETQPVVNTGTLNH